MPSSYQSVTHAIAQAIVHQRRYLIKKEPSIALLHSWTLCYLALQLTPFPDTVIKRESKNSFQR